MNPNFSKNNGLIPAIIQDENTGKVLMLGYMSQEAYAQTLESRLVTFFSRSKNRIWVKGETSGNFLHLSELLLDCDNDTILCKVKPAGAVCHTGMDTCFEEKNDQRTFFIDHLKKVIHERKMHKVEGSYTHSLFEKGINKIAQKVGEEAVELVIESMGNDDKLFKEEAADLLFHYLILLEQKNIDLNEIMHVLEARQKS